MGLSRDGGRYAFRLNEACQGERCQHQAARSDGFFPPRSGGRDEARRSLNESRAGNRMHHFPPRRGLPLPKMGDILSGSLGVLKNGTKASKLHQRKPPSLPPSKTCPLLERWRGPIDASPRGGDWGLPFTASGSTHRFPSSTGSGVSILTGGGGGKARRELRGHGHCGGGAWELGKIQGPNIWVKAGISKLARWFGEDGRNKFAVA